VVRFWLAPRHKRWTLARTGAAVFPLGILLAAACAPSPAPQQPLPPQAPAPAAAPRGPQKGGELRVGATTKATSLNAYRDAGAGSNTVLTGPVYDNLITFNYRPDVDWRKDLNDLAPQLASKWVQKDPLTFDFTIQEGVKWSDGTPFTAADVVWSYNYWREPKNAFTRASLIAGADKIEAPDARTVRFTLKAPAFTFLPNLAEQYAGIFPKHIGETGADFEKLEQLVGTGPFKVVSWDRDTRAQLVRNETYWDAGKPYVDKITVLFGMDQSARLAAFVAKEIDVHYVTDEKTYQTVKTQLPDIEGEVNIGNTHVHIYINNGKKPFDDVRVRKALHLAVDRATLNKVVSGGKGQINPPLVWGGTVYAIPQEELLKRPGYRADKTQDLADAKRLLSEAGFPSGLKAVVKTSSELVSTPPVQQAFVEQMKKIGVELEDRQTDRASFTKEFNAKEYELSTWIFSSPDPDQPLSTRLHSKSTSNVSNVEDSRLDEMIAAQREAQTTDQRKKVLRDLQEYLEEKVYLIPTIDYASWSMRQGYLQSWVDNRGVDPFMNASQIFWLDQAKMPKR